MSKHSINLFCFPFAGGSSYFFKKVETFLDDSIHIITPELPGRGRRIAENLLRDVHEVVEDLFLQICDQLHTPYAFYGHSMGTLVGYLLACKIKAEGLPQPRLLFFSGRGGPSFIKQEAKRYNLPRKEFFEELRCLGGSPEEILEDEVMMEFFEPIIRADFEVVESYSHIDMGLLDVAIHVIYGDNENLSDEEIACWQKESSISISVTKLPGDHFFIYKQSKKLAAYLNFEINKYGTSSLLKT